MINQIVIQYYLAQKRDNAHLINVTGRQRMLSQRLPLLAYTVQTRPSSYNHSVLNNTLHEWKQMHSSLRSGALAEGLVKDLPSVQQRLRKMDFQVDIADEMLSHPMTLKAEDLQELVLNQQTFLLEMDETVASVEAASDERLTSIIYLEIFLAALTLIVLFLEVRFIFWPILRSQTEQNQALLQSNNLLEQYAYASSHQLKEPVQNILNFVRLLKRNIKPVVQSEEALYLQFIEKGAADIKSKTDSLLQLALIQNKSLQHIAIDCDRVIREVARPYIQQARRQGGQLVILPVEAIIDGDESLFRDLWDRLFSNALKFQHQDRVPNIEVASKIEGGRLLISIRDNGIGIESNYREEIYEMFKQLHPQHHFNGDGVGLTLSKAIVERHRGKMWFESLPGQGSIFYVQLPLA
ncbi:MAG: ATP-binding protein [Bacteroidota bacterium]